VQGISSPARFAAGFQIIQLKDALTQFAFALQHIRNSLKIHLLEGGTGWIAVFRVESFKFIESGFEVLNLGAIQFPAGARGVGPLAVHNHWLFASSRWLVVNIIRENLHVPGPTL
jgi:hypothetical protein